MGYYTRYELTIHGNSENWVTGKTESGVEVRVNIGLDFEAIRAEIVKNSGYLDLFNDTIKWYDHIDHMKEISKRYPDLMFELSGEGEESGDLWIKYFKNGKMQHAPAEIVYAPFDESKLV